MDNRKCGPRISEAAADKLKNRYVLMRTGARDHEMETDKKTSIPITVRLDKQNWCNKIAIMCCFICICSCLKGSVILGDGKFKFFGKFMYR